MKKVFMMAVAACMATVSANAQFEKGTWSLQPFTCHRGAVPVCHKAVYDFFIDVFGLDRSMLDESKIEIEPEETLKSLYK